jgi:hypothetical protein
MNALKQRLRAIELATHCIAAVSALLNADRHVYLKLP